MAAHLRRSLVAVVAGAAFVMGAVGSTEARVTQITMSAPTPLFNGQTFGSAGAYEQIKGTAKGELDPADRHNVVITDIQFAPKNANGAAVVWSPGYGGHTKQSNKASSTGAAGNRNGTSQTAEQKQ